jgi:hypothetical protein
MKKWLIGCSAVLAIVLVAGGILTYIFVVRPVRAVVNSAQELTQIVDLNKTIKNISSFQMPEGGLLSAEQLERFMAVQTGIRERLAASFDQLEAKYQEIEAQGRDLHFKELMSAYADLFKLIKTAKEAQVAELNAKGFSLEEYNWVKQEALRASGIPFAGFDLSQIANEDAKALPVSTAPAPEANIKLLEPYKDKLEEYLSLAFFGL